MQTLNNWTNKESKTLKVWQQVVLQLHIGITELLLCHIVITLLQQSQVDNTSIA